MRDPLRRWLLCFAFAGGTNVPALRRLHRCPARRSVHTALSRPAPPPPTAPPAASFAFDLSPTPLRVLFFGSDAFSLRTLTLLCSSASSSSFSTSALPVAVVCPSESQGHSRQPRPIPVHVYAEEQCLPVFPVPHHINFRMDGWELPASPFDGGFDVGVVASFGHFVPKRVIAAFPLGMINLHPSMLPKYRGASPIQQALLNDDHHTGVSIIDLHPTRMDAGSILLQLTEPITAHDTFESLSTRLGSIGAQAILHSLNHLHSLRATAIPQADTTSVPTAPKLATTFGALDWGQEAREVYNRYRACKGFMNCYTEWREQRMNISEVRGVDRTTRSQEVGHVMWDKAGRVLRVQCGDRQGLLVTALQPANKKVMDAVSFANGYMLADRSPGMHGVRFGPSASTKDGAAEVDASVTKSNIVRSAG